LAARSCTYSSATSSRRASTTSGSPWTTSRRSTASWSDAAPSTARPFGNHLVELPGDVVQLYVRDPAGNLVEIDHHGVDRLPDELRAQLKGVWELHPQTDEHLRGRLFVPE
jgi:hypothetical protein